MLLVIEERVDPAMNPARTEVSSVTAIVDESEARPASAMRAVEPSGYIAGSASYQVFDRGKMASDTIEVGT